MRPLGESTPALLIRTSSRPKRSTAPRHHGFDLVVVADVRQHRLDRTGTVHRPEAGDRGVQRGRAHVAEHEVGGGLAGELLCHGGTECPARADDCHDPLRRRHTNKYPPSTLSTVPVMKAAASEARNW